ncbi:TPA: acyltransferase [Proteus mirabilis]|nr:acyltransferase [Proteus mirabilis]
MNGLDLFRFIAALFVILFHYTYRGSQSDHFISISFPEIDFITKYGYLGVQFFFMISGFVIMMSSHHGSYKKFLISRISRLYPTFWLCCTLTYIITLLLNDNIALSANLKQYFVNLTMLAGFFKVPSIDGAYWSLYVEIYFYVLIFTLLIFKKINKLETYLGYWLAITILADIFNISAISKLFMTNYSIYFIAGGLFYYIWIDKINIHRLILITICIIYSITVSVEQANYLSERYNDYYSNVTISIILFAFYLSMGYIVVFKNSIINKINWIKLGALTYPLYLLHQNIGYILINQLSNLNIMNKYTIILFIIFLMIIISYIIGNIIEPKQIKNTKKLLMKIIK